MLRDDLSLLVFSCGAFSDIWEGQIKLLDRHWGKRDIDTFLVSDTNPQDISFDNVKILLSGEGSEFTDRLIKFLENCTTDYVFITLDDYYLISDVSNDRIEYLLDYMKSNDLDYMRIWKLAYDGKAIEGTNGLHEMGLHEEKCNYYVNLYPGIWKKEFLAKTVEKRLNPWQFEVSLTPLAKKLDAKCVVDRADDYVILDVVRKGKLLHKSAKYFKEHPDIYTGNRTVISYAHEIRIKLSFYANRLLPRKLAFRLKGILKKFGMKFYS